MINIIRTLTYLSDILSQIVNLKPGEVVCDQNITLLRWLIFGFSTFGVLLCLTVLWINSAVEAGLTNLSRYRLQAMKDRREQRVHIIDDLLSRPAQIASAISLLNTICLIIATALAITAIHQFNMYGLEVTLVVMVLTFMVLSLAKTLPKGYAL